MKERFGFIIFAFLALVLVAGLSLQAVAGKYADEKEADRLEIRLSKAEQRQTTQAAKQLNHAIDLWHDANLKSDNGMISRFEEKLNHIIEADVESSYAKVRRFEAEVNRSSKEQQSRSGNQINNRDDYRDFRDDVRDLKTARELAKVKEKLAYSIKHSPSFSNKYRLLNDYLDVLSREVGLNRVELAEDFEQWQDDK